MGRARTIASGFGVDVLVCQPPPVIPAGVIAEPAIVAVAPTENLSDVEEWVREIVADLVDAGINVTVGATAKQPKYEAILNRAEESGADLILRMVGERGRLKRLFVGTTDWDLIRHAKQPLWLVQPDDEGLTSSNVLVAVDPTHPKDEHMKLDKLLLEFANGLSKKLSGSLHVYHTYRTLPPIAAMSSVPTQADAGLIEKVESAHRRVLMSWCQAMNLGRTRCMYLTAILPQRSMK